MAVGTEVTAVRYEDIVAGTPISVPFPLYEALDVKVYYGSAALLATYNTDYTVTLGDDFDTFTLVPLSSLLMKINTLIAADPTNEENYITVRRELDYKTDATAAAVRYTPFTAREFERTVLRFQQLDERMNRALTLPPTFVGTTPLTLPTPETGKSLIWNAEGPGLENGPNAEDIANAREYAERAEEAAASLTGNLVTPTNLFVGSVFSDDNDTSTRLYLSSDGVTFNRLNNVPLTMEDGSPVVGRDPALQWDEITGYWYLTTTIYELGVYDFTVYRSRDLTKNYKRFRPTFGPAPIGSNVNPAPGGSTPCNFMWAPKRRRIGGKVYILISLRFAPDAPDYRGISIPFFRPFYAEVLSETDSGMTLGAPTQFNIPSDLGNKIDVDLYEELDQVVMVIKDEFDKNIEVFSAPTIDGVFTAKSVVDFAIDVEGPTMVRVYRNDGTFFFRLYADGFYSGFYLFRDSTDLVNWQPDNYVRSGYAMRHGKFIQLAKAGVVARQQVQLASLFYANADQRSITKQIALPTGESVLVPEDDTIYYVGADNVATLTISSRGARRFYLAVLSGSGKAGISVRKSSVFPKAYRLGFGASNDRVVQVDLNNTGLGAQYYVSGAVEGIVKPSWKAIVHETHAPDSFSAVNKQIMSRVPYFARDTINYCQFEFPNWYTSAVYAETGTGGTATISAAIEFDGRFIPITFNGGAASATVASGGVLQSDVLFAGIPDGAKFFVRTFYTNPAGIIWESHIDVAQGARAVYAPSGLADLTLGGNIVDGGADAVYGPQIILGDTTRPAIMLIGDSRSYGSFDGYDEDYAQGALARCLARQAAVVNMARNGDTAQAYRASNSHRTSLKGYIDTVVTAYGINDLSAGRTAAQLQADVEYILSLFPEERNFVATVEPKTTSSDGWATVENQTVDGANAARIAYNEAVRAGLRRQDGYFDVADALESARNSGKWRARMTGDGLHANQRGCRFAAAMNAANVAMLFEHPAEPPRPATWEDALRREANDKWVSPALLGVKYACKAHRNNVDQTGIVPGVATKFAFTTAGRQVGGGLDVANSQWVCPKSGDYFIAAQVLVIAGTVPDSNNQLAIYVNGNFACSTTVPGQAQNYSIFVAKSLDLVEGDIIDIRMNLNGAGNKTIQGSPGNSWFEATLK